MKWLCARDVTRCQEHCKDRLIRRQHTKQAVRKKSESGLHKVNRKSTEGLSALDEVTRNTSTTNDAIDHQMSRHAAWLVERFRLRAEK